MTSRRRNMMRARIKSILVRRRKRYIVFKYIKILLIVIIIPILITSIMTMIIQEKKLDSDNVKQQKQLYIPYEYLKKAYRKSSKEGVSFSKVLTYSADEANFVVDGYTDKILSSAIKLTKNNEKMTKSQEALYDIYSKIFDDLKVGPIPKKTEIYIWNKEKKKREKSNVVEYSYTSVDDFGDVRTYGSERAHEGNDLIADIGTPIVSITDGEITRIGWNKYGGQRIGITSSKGTYFYYAHMDRYADGMIMGKKINAGDVIGYVGNTGYGPPGTKGKFVSHLHIQIGFKMGKFSKEYTWFNPYDVVKFLDDCRVTLVENKS